jgi:glycosyltransferase involved in cell wall biosynthesis
MRILQINNCHYRRGGADVVYLNTGKLLEDYGNEVFYFSQKNDANFQSEDSDNFVNEISFFKKTKFEKLLSVPRFFYSKEASVKIEKLIRRVKPQVAHIHTYKGTLTPSILKKLKKHSIPIVITLHDYGFLCPHNSFLDGKKEICTKCLDTGNSINGIINRCNRNSFVYSSISVLEYKAHKIFFKFEKYFDHLIAVSKFNFNLHFKKEEFRNKMSQIYNFVNLNQITPNTTKGDYFLFYGRLSDEKGILTLLRAWLEVGDNIQLKIAGDGPLKENILSFIDENNLTNVQYLGFKQKDELFALLSNSSFNIVPSEWYENNPLTVLESYALGKPVIGANVGGIPEIINDAETGFIFEMKNFKNLSEVIKKASQISNQEYLVFSKNARKFAEDNFSEKNHYNKLMTVYNKLINEK